MEKKYLTIILVTALSLQVLSNSWSGLSSFNPASAQLTQSVGNSMYNGTFSIYNGTFDIEPKSKENFTIDFKDVLEYNTSYRYTILDIFLPEVDFGDFWAVLLRNESEVIYDSPLDYSNLTTGWFSLISIKHVTTPLAPRSDPSDNSTVLGMSYGYDDGIVDENPYIFTIVFYNNNSYPLNYPFEIQIIEPIYILYSSAEGTSTAVATTSSDVTSATSSSLNVLMNPLVVLVLAVVGARLRYKRPQS